MVQRRRLEGSLHPDQGRQVNSDLLGKGNAVPVRQPGHGRDPQLVHLLHQPGRAGQGQLHLGRRGRPRRTTASTTAKLHADTFSILNTTKNPDEAFDALAALVASPELLTNYGAFPADPALQQSAFDAIQKQLPGLEDRLRPSRRRMLGYADKPSHQAWMPDYAEVQASPQGRLQQVSDH